MALTAFGCSLRLTKYSQPCSGNSKESSLNCAEICIHKKSAIIIQRIPVYLTKLSPFVNALHPVPEPLCCQTEVRGLRYRGGCRQATHRKAVPSHTHEVNCSSGFGDAKKSEEWILNTQSDSSLGNQHKSMESQCAFSNTSPFGHMSLQHLCQATGGKYILPIYLKSHLLVV